MNLRNLAQANLKDAQMRLRVAYDVNEREEYHFCIRLCQEAIELALKGALRLANIDPPNWHDVGIVLKRNISRFPDWFQEQIDELAMISRDLCDERERSMYGDESLGIAPGDLYTKRDANTALLSADKVVGDCQKLIKEDVFERN